jgi:hypothetical protein
MRHPCRHHRSPATAQYRQGSAPRAFAAAGAHDTTAPNGKECQYFFCGLLQAVFDEAAQGTNRIEPKNARDCAEFHDV